jgi:hypothetical protein
MENAIKFSALREAKRSTGPCKESVIRITDPFFMGSLFTPHHAKRYARRNRAAFSWRRRFSFCILPGFLPIGGLHGQEQTA